MMHPKYKEAMDQVKRDLADAQDIGVPSTIVSNAHLREIIPVADSMANVMNAATKGTEIPFKDILFHPERWHVVFHGIKDYPPRRIEHGCFLGDFIVVITVDDGRGRESLWFDKDGKHIKGHRLESILCLR